MTALLSVLYREYLIRTTSLMWLFFDLIVPVMYLLMFGVGFNSAFMSGIPMEGRLLSYNEFFLAGVISMACFGLAMNQSYGFFVDRDNGIFYETLTYPITRNQFLLGKILFQCLLAVVQTILTLTAAVVLLGVSVPLHGIPVVLAGILIGTAGWFFVFASVAFLIKRNDMFSTIINVAYFVLLFVSSMFYPLDQLPAAFRWVAMANPVTWHTDVLRWALVGTGDPAVVTLEAVGFALFAFAGFRVAIRALKRAVE